MNEESLGGFGVILIIAIIWLGVSVHNKNKQIEELTSIIHNCDYAVTEANQNISDLNDQIENASYYAWNDYETMGQTIEDLQQGEQVNNPCYTPFK